MYVSKVQNIKKNKINNRKTQRMKDSIKRQEKKIANTRRNVFYNISVGAIPYDQISIKAIINQRIEYKILIRKFVIL